MSGPGPDRAGGSARTGRAGPVVTLDGPAGSGKSTTAREVARRLGYRHLDSGALYRVLTWALVRAAVPVERWPALGAADLDALDVRIEAADPGFRLLVGGREPGDEIRTPEINALVSRLAPLPAVRAWLLGAQRDAGRDGRLVADGRDMGTVVFPDAEVKVFLTADLGERARRRLAERGAAHPTVAELGAEAARIEERDRRDSERALSPLRRPDGALVVDTTRLSFEEQVEIIVRRVREVDASAEAV